MNRLGDSYRYKNSNPKILKDEEIQRSITPASGSVGGSRLLAASAVFDAFVVAGNDVVVTSRDVGGDHLGPRRLVKSHADDITDIAFSPFDDQLLATASNDRMLKLWTLSSSSSFSFAALSLSMDGPIASLRWHPAASGILAAAVDDVVKIADAERSEVALTMEPVEGRVQSVTWGRANGSLLASTASDRMLRLFDPRASSSASSTFTALPSARDSCCCWLGSSDRLLVSSLAQDRKRQIALWDVKAGKAIETETFDVASGLLVPLYDVDTEMTFLYGRGSSFLHFYHVDAVAASPFRHCATWHADNNVVDAVLTPKRGVRLMDAEVNRVVVLTRNALLPVSWIPARKNYKEFHEDLFPPTRGGKAACDAAAWRDGNADMAADEALRPGKKLLTTPKKSDNHQDQNGNASHATASAPPPDVENPVTPTNPLRVSASPKPSPLAGLFVSKFKHVKMELDKKSRWIENVPPLSMAVPGNSDMFAVNELRFAVPLKGVGAGGGLAKVLVVDFGINFDGKRLEDVGLPTIENGSAVLDLVFSPFDGACLLTASEDGKIREWRIPTGGLKEQMTEPKSVVQAHSEKLYFVRFHPLVSDLIISSSYDMTMKLWDWRSKTLLCTISDFPDEIFCCCFSYSDPTTLLTVSKDKELRRFRITPGEEAASATSSAASSASIAIGQRGARCFLACDDSLIVVSAFSRQSHRQLAVYDSETLDALTVMDLDSNPSILIPHYDVDTSVVFLTGRGDSLVLAFQVIVDSPYLVPLSHASLGAASGSPLHQCLGFLPKKLCDVASVQIACAMRLCPGVVQPVSFTVPRVKMEFFQDDLYPPATPTWIPAASVDAFWRSEPFTPPEKKSLKPAHMKALSEAPVIASTPKKYDFATELKKEKSEEEKKEELLAAMSTKLELDKGKPLPQDEMDGVDSDEWDD